MKTKTTFKTAKVIQEYPINFQGWHLIIPIGATVSNQTATGPHDSYRFWIDWKEQVEKLTGYSDSMLAHDLTYYGVNVPAELCEPYKQ